LDVVESAGDRASARTQSALRAWVTKPAIRL
jgi:hypothetical protein